MQLDSIKLIPIPQSLWIGKITDAEYFSKRYSKYISNSRLGLLNPLNPDASPEAFFEGFKDPGFVESFQLGSAVHEISLQPEYFEIAPDLGKPSAKLGEVADRLFNLGCPTDMESIKRVCGEVNYYAKSLTDYRITALLRECKYYWKNRTQFEATNTSKKEMIHMDTRLRNTAISCIEELQKCQEVQDLLHPEGAISECEQAILLDVLAVCPNGKSTVLKLKAKLDHYSIDVKNNKVVINDVKTYRTNLDNNIASFHYEREFAMYYTLLSKVCDLMYGMKDYSFTANYLGICTIQPGHEAYVRPVYKDEFHFGLKSLDKLLKYVAYLQIYKGYDFK